jgi:Holliday junction DNA helicase RuvA
MIAYLNGTLASKDAGEAIIDIGGVGYSVTVPLSTYENLPAIGQTVRLLTYQHFREDLTQLFGFLTDEERQLFKLLISISGVGPKMAQNILSGITASSLRETIIAGNPRPITEISGVGKKTAERIIIELRDKITKLDLKMPMGKVTETSQSQQSRSDAFSALLSLGYTRAAAEKAMRAAIAEAPTAKVDDLIRIALKQIQK